MSKLFIARVVVVILFLGALLFASSAKAPFARIPAPQEPSPSIIFVGDIMLDRNVAVHAEAVGTQALFAGVQSLLKSADARVANLEGTITQNPSIARQDHTILHFTFDPALAQAALAPLNLSAVSLANNHAYDFGRLGFDTTQEYLKSWGIKAFGHPYNARDISTVLDVRGKQFCLVGYHALYDPSTTEVVQEIQRLKPSCYRVIAFAHWGVEYEPQASAEQVAQAHALVDAGADLVIGAHPHVVENIETYSGKAIFYSLGNFMFDQDFSWATTHGLAVKVTFDATSTAFDLTPITVAGQEATVANEADAARVLETTGRLASWRLP
ncbi:MAG TPA: CapA family protein [Candidatus Paceibacterota bacterium]|jgi:poly-gamma-glutamate synthesis protein (capsule biosynthesis protein)|nr:CapA family protein [Candidatus Paceibacterota bacterium]